MFAQMDNFDSSVSTWDVSFTQASARSNPDSGQRDEVRGHGCLFGMDVSEQHNIFIYIF